jgi:hypothetical protein
MWRGNQQHLTVSKGAFREIHRSIRSLVFGRRSRRRRFPPTSSYWNRRRGSSKTTVEPAEAGPCGGSNTDWGKPSYIISKAIGGRSCTSGSETIYHPGHYRVSLAINSPRNAGGSADHHQRKREEAAVRSAAIQNPVQIPVLADGLFVHATRPTGTMAPFEAGVQLPNITCKMHPAGCAVHGEHGFNNPGRYSYHHCANIQITADPKKPLDQGWRPSGRSAPFSSSLEFFPSAARMAPVLVIRVVDATF